MTKSIIFKLDDDSSMVLSSENSIEEWHYCYTASITFSFKNLACTFPIHDIERHMEYFSEQLKQALNNDLKLHVSINDDIGYLWNESYWNKPGLVYEGEEDEAKLWIGHQFKMWTSRSIEDGFSSVWIYNNKIGEIILEITPDYPWFECEPQDYENYISYEQWIKSYKPLVIRTIPAEVAKNWVKQADEIVKQIEENANTGE